MIESDLKVSDVLSLLALIVTIVALVLAVFAFMKELQFNRLKRKINELDYLVVRNRTMFEYTHAIDDIISSYIEENADISYGHSQEFRVLLNTLINPSSNESLVCAFTSLGSFTNELRPQTHWKLKNFLIFLWHNRWFHQNKIQELFVREFKDKFEDYPPPIITIPAVDRHHYLSQNDPKNLY